MRTWPCRCGPTTPPAKGYGAGQGELQPGSGPPANAGQFAWSRIRLMRVGQTEEAAVTVMLKPSAFSASRWRAYS